MNVSVPRSELLPILRGIALQTAILAAILLAHEFLRGPYSRLHVLTIPLLAIPVAYYSSVLGVRGAIMAAIFSALIIVDHVNDRHPLILAFEVAQVGAISLFGAVVATLANRERALDERVGEESRQRLQRLAGAPGYWDRVGVTKMGLYVTRVESDFISQALARRPDGVTADIGAGSGRLHPAIVPQSSGVFATDVDADALRTMRPAPNVVPIVVAPRRQTLPFRSDSIDAVIAIEVPAVSDQNWFRSECDRVLRPEGRVIVTVHNALSYKGAVSRLLGRWRAMRGKSWANLYYRYGLSVHVREWARAGFELRAQTGYYWPPLPRDSNGTWVAVAATLERLTGLRLLAGWSPWVLLELEKIRQ
jgi:SAM-dependent methyltransferase